MKTLLITLLSWFSTLSVGIAQEMTPVLWSYTVERNAGNDTITVRMDASIAPMWYLYAEKEDKDSLSVGLHVKITQTENCMAVGVPDFSNTKLYHSSGLDESYVVMQDRGSIRQRFVKTKATGRAQLSIDYMAMSEDVQRQQGVVVKKSEKIDVEF
ncbi:hypothetical protein [Arundinibacter roseus]|uniref:Uncharacterized protein n=1 Tax=Arundinibacter roseus TaxID=2070510 RepID=A0A4V2X9U4_9BACT|nr:hypothetical protein [Arundinibacter roseus]TDB65125.1 hypothetical protein EZE20_10455 [Arundinibacter roseus]